MLNALTDGRVKEVWAITVERSFNHGVWRSEWAANGTELTGGQFRDGLPASRQLAQAELLNFAGSRLG